MLTESTRVAEGSEEEELEEAEKDSAAAQRIQGEVIGELLTGGMNALDSKDSGERVVALVN